MIIVKNYCNITSWKRASEFGTNIFQKSIFFGSKKIPIWISAACLGNFFSAYSTNDHCYCLLISHALLSEYHSLHHRWNVPWATPSSFAAALPDSSPLRHAAMIDV